MLFVAAQERGYNGTNIFEFDAGGVGRMARSRRSRLSGRRKAPVFEFPFSAAVFQWFVSSLVPLVRICRHWEFARKKKKSLIGSLP